MGKSNNVENKKRATKKGNKKKTFKKFGKNTARGVRIKQAEMEKKGSQAKGRRRPSLGKSPDGIFKNQGKVERRTCQKSMCKITLSK